MRHMIEKEILEQAAALRHELHRHPELSMQETWTRKHLIQFLKEHTSLEIVDRGRWFYAVYHKDDSAKKIAFRADFDAVPVQEAKELVPYCSENEGVGHKCGHDGHSAALAAFAMQLDRCGADCNVYLLFQHAEETGQGAQECLPFLKENGIDEIFAVHNMPGLELGAVAVAEGVVQYASTGMTISFQGLRSHACYPEDGRNPAYAISEMVVELEKLRAAQKYQGLTLITIIGIRVGEHAFGTGAGEGELLLTVRGENGEELADLIRHIEQMAEQKAAVYGLKWSVQYEDAFEDCFNHRESVEKVRNAAEQAGIKLQDLEEPFRASEDFGRFTKEVPGAIFYVGSGREHPALHTPDFDFPDEILEVIAVMYCALVKSEQKIL
ncbi:MAG: amidohydrolase [Eubacteriales bacterium]|nr:amidohydrolase [Eubacteriales bacterium]